MEGREELLEQADGVALTVLALLRVTMRGMSGYWVDLTRKPRPSENMGLSSTERGFGVARLVD